MAKLPTRRKIFDVAGESHDNPDGTSRQTILRACRPGQSVVLERQPDNKFDRNAIFVTVAGQGVGFLSRADAELLAPHLDEGRTHAAQIHELTGGMPDYPSIGCRISIAWDGSALPACIVIDPKQTAFNPRKPQGCLGVLALLLVVTIAWVQSSGGV